MIFTDRILATPIQRGYSYEQLLWHDIRIATPADDTEVLAFGIDLGDTEPLQLIEWLTFKDGEFQDRMGRHPPQYQVHITHWAHPTGPRRALKDLAHTGHEP